MQSREKTEMIFPDCWSDDVRMDVMFAPFRLKSVNPENYESKLKFWRDMIVRLCDHKGSPSFNLPELRIAFQRRNKLPYGLETVIEDMNTCKALRIESEFLSDPQNTWSGWAVNTFVKKPFKWGWQRATSVTTNQPTQGETKYIHLDVLKKQSQLLEKLLETFAGEILPIERIEKLEGMQLNQEGLFICLVHLSSLNKIFVEYKLVDGQRQIVLVKIPDRNVPATPITEVDRAIYALEKSEQNLLKMLDEIEAQVTKNENLARQNIREGKRLVAKSYLRKKHQLEKNLEKRSVALDNIQTILTRIQETKSNGDVLDAYKIGSETMKSLLSQSDLNADNIDEVVDNIKESLEIHDEVQQSLSSVQLIDKAEDSALEQELLELMEDNNKPPENKPKPHEPKVINVKSDEEKELIKQLERLEVVSGSLSLANNCLDNINVK